MITEAYLAGAPDEQVAAHTRHGDLSTMRGYRKLARIADLSFTFRRFGPNRQKLK